MSSRLKGSGIIITKDLTHLNIQRLNRLKQHDGVTDAWSTSGGRLYIKSLDLSVLEVKNGDMGPIDRKLIGVTREGQCHKSSGEQG